MPYSLVTGATGLLGTYLLRDGLLAGRHMALLARPNRSQSARHRIETILTGWEKILGKALPRPVVLEGDLVAEDLGLEGADLRWISRHCTSVVHNAASLTFQGGNRSDEPWLSNVTGTRRVLDLCRRTGIREFHYVSTAYVCGLREGRVLESELDVGQDFGNDYERSKNEAETMVRNADFLGPVTVYRPSIILGDSRTGRTTTYHGFYAVLRLAHTLVSRLAKGDTAGGQVVAGLGMCGHERKNFVPVDWVSAVMTHILTRPEHYGKTYHLVTQNPLPVAKLADLVQRAVETYSTLASEADASRCNADWFSRNLFNEMAVYRTYWRDDPQFDVTNTTAAAPHLPCPELDDATLLRLAKFAIDNNFGKIRVRPVQLDFDVHEHFRSSQLPSLRFVQNRFGEASLGLQVDGAGGGQWRLVLRDGRLTDIEPGLTEACTAVFHLDSSIFRRLVAREFSVEQAVQTGQVAIRGNGFKPRELEAALEAAITSGSKTIADQAGDLREHRAA
jgi:thioester reductase-like protein